MRPRTFCLTAAEADELQEAFRHCHEARVKTRYQAVRLYGSGHDVEHILDICACNRTSLLEWARAYRQGGLTALLDHRQGGNRARLKPDQIEAVQAKLHRYTPAQLFERDDCVGSGQFWTVPDVAHLLEREYGVTYQSRTSYQTLLQKCSLSYQRPAKQYKSHSEAKLMDFQERLEKKLGDIAQDAPQTVVLAADEASLYLQASLTRVWAPVGQTPLVRVAAGRDNTHFYGALDLATGEQTTLRSELMNAQASALFLNRLLAAYPDKPLLLLWDRAPWHKGEAIGSVLSANPRLEILRLEILRLEILWFPPGCPELNPQEHVWKAVREAVSHNQGGAGGGQPQPRRCGRRSATTKAVREAVSHNHGFAKLPQLADALVGGCLSWRMP